jgi:hypothetical protein
MIKFLYVHLFYGKRRILFYASLAVIPLLIYMLSLTGVSLNQEILFHDDYQLYYEEITQKSLMLLIPFFIITLTMDHDQPYLKPMIAYFGRLHVLLSKIMLFIIILSWFYLMVFLSYHVIPALFSSYYHVHQVNFGYFIHIYLDGIFLMLIVTSFIKDRQKAFSIIFAILYILLSLYQEDQQSIQIFYALPIYFSSISLYNLAILYKMCYIFLVLVLSIKKMLKEEI